MAAAFDAGSEADRAALTAGLGDPALDEVGVARLREVIVGTGALQRTEQRIEELHDRAVAALAEAEIEQEAAEVLTKLAAAASRRLG